VYAGSTYGDSDGEIEKTTHALAAACLKLPAMYIYAVTQP
jgi:hypothetical protein